MKSESPEGKKEDRPITDEYEIRLFNLQITQQEIAAKVASGDPNPLYKKLLKILNKQIELGGKIIGEKDQDKKDELKDELDDYLDDPEVMATVVEWAALKEKEERGE